MKKEITKKLNILWKILFYILFLLSIPTIIGVFVAPEIPGISSGLLITSGVFFVFNLLGIYSLVWRKKIFNVFFWRLFFVAIVLPTVYYIIVGIEGLPPMTTFDIISTSIFSFIVYVPIYIYAFCSKDLWEGGVSVDI